MSNKFSVIVEAIWPSPRHSGSFERHTAGHFTEIIIIISQVSNAECFRRISHPDFSDALVVVLAVEPQGVLGQFPVIRSHGSLQEDVDGFLRGGAEQLNKHRLHSFQAHGQGRCDQEADRKRCHHCWW